MMKKNVLYTFVFCLTFASSFKSLSSCSCEPFNFENAICKSQFAVLVLVTGIGPETKNLDSYYVEIRQSFKMNYDAAKAFRDYGSGLVYTTRKHNSCALRIKSNELYFIYGDLNHRKQPMITFCTTLKYETEISDEDKKNLNLVSMKGLNCKKSSNYGEK